MNPMTDLEMTAISGVVIDDEVELTLEQVTYFCAAKQDQITALVEEGVLQPRGYSHTEWLFSGRLIHRAAKAIRLQRELEVNAHAVAVILDLLDEIAALRARQRLDGDPPEA